MTKLYEHVKYSTALSGNKTADKFVCTKPNGAYVGDIPDDPLPSDPSHVISYCNQLIEFLLLKPDISKIVTQGVYERVLLNLWQAIRQMPEAPFVDKPRKLELSYDSEVHKDVADELKKIRERFA